MDIIELKDWLNGFVKHNTEKIKYMEEKVPGHKNIKFFKVEVEFAKKIIEKIEST